MENEQKLFSLGRVGELLFIAVVYAALGKVGQFLAIPPGNVTAVWPPSGFALAVMMLIGPRAWMGIGLGAFIVNTIAFFDMSSAAAATNSLLVGTFIGLGSALQPYIGIKILTSYFDFSTLNKQVRSFIIFAAVVPIMCLVSSTIGTASILTGGFVATENIGELWLTWWLGDSVGVFLFTPLILAWNNAHKQEASPRSQLNLIVAFVLLGATSLISFGALFIPVNSSYPLEFLTWPCLLWLALKHGDRAATTGIIVLATIAIWQTVEGHGPFHLDNPNLSLLMLQLFLSVTTVTVLLICALAEERRKSGALVKQAMEKERIASEAKSHLLASMSHELRTPMNAIIGFSQLMDSDKKNPPLDEHKEYLAHILKNGKTLLELIDQVLELSKIGGKEFKINIEEVNVKSALRECLEGLERKAGENSISLECACAEGSCPNLKTDRRRFYQVIGNLVSNAIKFNRPGGKVILGCTQLDDGALRISVHDTGIGFPQEKHERLFEPFDKLDRETGPIDGAGVGLAITERVVAGLGGSIGAVSTEGKGSEFWVELPITPPTKTTH